MYFKDVQEYIFFSLVDVDIAFLLYRLADHMDSTYINSWINRFVYIP